MIRQQKLRFVLLVLNLASVFVLLRLYRSNHDPYAAFAAAMNAFAFLVNLLNRIDEYLFPKKN